MPEGHTTHRLARRHRKLLAGRPVAADSPQGRFAEGAARIDGALFSDADAYGKHLFHRYRAADGTALTLHVHLGLYGRWTEHEPPGPQPTAGTRLRLVGDGIVLHLAGPTACELVDPAGEERILARLGPDPLRRDADPERSWAALRRRRTPIGAALLDQAVIAGVGNVFRAEALFLCGIHPERPANEVSRAEWDCLWDTLSRHLRTGVRLGRIVTRDPAEVGASGPGRIPDEERLYVYRRGGQPCRRCNAPVRRWELGARMMHACDSCQR